MNKISTLLRLFYPLIFGIGLFISMFILRYNLKHELINSKIGELENYSYYLDKLISENNNNPVNLSISKSMEKINSKTLNYYQLIFLSHNGELYYCQGECNNINGKDLLFSKEITIAHEHKNHFGYNVQFSVHAKKPDENKKYIFYAHKFKDYYIRIAIPYTDISHSVNKIDFQLVISIFIGLILIIFVNSYFSKIIVKPIQNIIQYSQKFIDGSISQFRYAKVHEVAQLQSSLYEVAKAVQKHISELSLRRDEVETVIKNVSDGVIILNKNLQLTLYNYGLLSLLNIDHEVYKDGIEGKYFYEIIRNNSINRLIEKSASEQTRLAETIHLTTIENKVLEVICIPLPNKSGMVILINDITEQYRLTEIKRSFVENVSHEFKTPISIIKGYIETIIKSENLPTNERNRFLQKVLRNTDRLNNLINDLITLNKLDESKDYFRKESVNIALVIENCLDILSMKAESKGIKLVNNITEEHIKFTGNPELLETIFFNLIDNGITYTESEGQVAVKCYKKPTQIVFTVTDTGIGVPTEHHERIFERFYRVDESRSRKSGGTGLGLSIVKHAVLFHNGEINCELNPNGRGSQFNVIFPIDWTNYYDETELESRKGIV
ncbi:MAG: ATP-binding protein [Spirochaetota bacterium]|nr:ATP-binding protein [Spirochaetota bacterium]